MPTRQPTSWVTSNSGRSGGKWRSDAMQAASGRAVPKQPWQGRAGYWTEVKGLIVNRLIPGDEQAATFG